MSRSHILLPFLLALALASYDEQLSIDGWRLTHMIDCGASRLEKWDCGYSCNLLKGQYSFIKLYNYETSVGQFQWAAYKDIKRDQLFLAFHGTEGNQQLITEILEGENEKYDIHDIPGSQVMLFFFNHYKQQLRADVLKQAQDYLNENPGHSIAFVGHSLGGAFATHAALDLILSGIIEGNKTSMYTWGCPRVGNWQFASKVSELIAENWRVVNYRDMVPHVPFCIKNIENKCMKSALDGPRQQDGELGDGWIFWYAWHTWNAVYYEADQKTFRTCNTGENNDCGDQWEFVESDPAYHTTYFNINDNCEGKPISEEKEEAIKFLMN